MPDTKPDAPPHEEWLLSSEEWIDARIEQWLGILRGAVYGAFVPLEAEFAPCADPKALAGWREADFRPFEPGAIWGQAWDYAWFRFRGTVPAEWRGAAVARIDLGGEAGVIGLNGEFSRRLTHGSVFDHWIEVDAIPLSAGPGEEVEIVVQAWASNLDGVSRPMDPDRSRPDFKGKHAGVLRRAELAVLRPGVQALLHDAEVLHGLARRSPERSVRRKRCYRALRQAIIAYADDPERAADAREVLRPELEKATDASAPTAVATGHAHIDSAWMWRLADSVGKCGRTFAHQLDYLERYPGYVFGASSPLHYEWTKEHYPETYEGIRKRIAEGRWEIQGAMWVEPDTNVPSGESLVRQFLYGALFVDREFGVDCPILWLPDVFGLSGSLPQICAQAGVKYFLTKKPHWGRDNAFRKTAFRWVGHDGSEVIAHLLPQVRDYNGRMTSDFLCRAVEGFEESDRLDEFLYTFGVGDGGGGPSEPMLERAVRMADVEGLPKVRFGRAEEVFRHFEERRPLLDAHHGEIYVEGHRGTYTTQGALKRANRRLEVLLGQVEQVYASRPPEDYPGAELERAWKIVLTNQFHDILPGSGIREVIEDALADYGRAEAVCADLLDRFARTLPEATGTTGLYNSLSAPWRGVVETEAGAADCPCQTEPDGSRVAAVELAPLAGANLNPTGAAPGTEPLREPILENGKVRAVFGENGQLLSLVDKESGRDWMAPAEPGNLLSLYVDRPVDWDAWDVDRFYREERVAVAEAAGDWTGWTGPARSVLEFRLRVGGSTIRQRCILAADSPRVDFETEVDWSERHKMLRVGFPAALRAGARLRSSVQHGFVDRPLHWNHSHDAARFEVPCQRWAALVDGEGGLALLNDGKAGVRGEDNLTEMALLRSSTFPDYDADRGRHRFTYAVLPFAGDSGEAGVTLEADRLNAVPLAFPGRDASGLRAPVAVDGPVALEALKRAERGGGLVARICNPEDRSAEVRLENLAGDGLVEVDALERETGPAEERFRLEPFRFRSFLLRES